MLKSFICLFCLTYSSCILGQEISISDSTTNYHVQSQLDNLQTQLNGLKAQLNLIQKLLQDKTHSESKLNWLEYSNSKLIDTEESRNYIDSFVERDINDSITCPSEMRLKRLGMTPTEYFTQNTPQDEEKVCYKDPNGEIIAGSGMVDGVSLKPKMYKEAYIKPNLTQNQTYSYSKSSAYDIAREIRRQEANAKAIEAGTELLLNLIFKPKNK